MSKKVSANTQKRLKHRFGKLAESMESYYDHLDFRVFEDFDDHDFAYVMEKVKGVNMLDLNETDITNDSIRMLTRLEYVYELRAKGCHRLDNGCVEYLNQLTLLTFLHLNSTAVTIDGLLQLNNLVNLKNLLFSSDSTESIEGKMLLLQRMLPDCAFTVNSRPWRF